MDGLIQIAPNTYLEEIKKAGESLVYSNAFNIPQELAYQNHGYIKALVTGLKGSVPGLAVTQKIPEYQPQGFAEETLAQVGQLAGDIPLMVAGFLIGGGPLSPITATGGAFALPAGLRKMYMDKLEKGDVKDFRDFTDRAAGAAWETVKGEATGMATAGAARFAPVGLKTATEIGTMVTVGSLLDGRVPTAKDFISATVLIGGLKVTSKVSNAIVPKLKQRYVETGEHPVQIMNDISKEIDPVEFSKLAEGKQVEIIEKAIEQKKTEQLSLFPELETKPSPHPIYGSVVKQRRLGKAAEERYAPPVYEGELARLKTGPDITQGTALSSTIRRFEEMPLIKEITYDRVSLADANRVRETIVINAEINTLFKDTTPANRERVYDYALSKQEKGKALLAWKQKTPIEKVEVPKLTPAEKAIYDNLRERYKSYYDRIQEARAAAGKEPFEAVEDYFTFIQGMTVWEKLGLDIIKSDPRKLQSALNEVYADFIRPKATPFGFSKKRTAALFVTEKDAKRVFERYTESALRHIHLSPEIAKIREFLLKIGKGKDAFEMQKEKPEAYKFLNGWLNKLAGVRDSWIEKKFGRKWDERLSVLNSNITVATLSANLRTAFIQPLSLLNTATYLGPKYTLRGIVEMLTADGKKTAMEKSNQLIARDYDVAAKDALHSLTGIKRAVAEKAMAPLKYLDMKSAQATWLGAYAKAKELLGFSDKKAAQFADDALVKTQASARTLDMAPIQYESLGRAMTLFQTFVLNEFAFIKSDVMGIGNKSVSGKTVVKRAATWITGVTLINILFEDILQINSPYPAPINAFNRALDKGDSDLVASKEALLEILAQLPIAGGGLRYGGTMLGGVADLFKDIGESFSGRRGKPWWEIAGKITGVPGIVQAKKISRGETLKEALLGKPPM
uniref:Uncharacterized protein n=1 Tax=viral metagenome TaxID=1070528 RepID=A0A6M3KFJ4_9ZZZZ